jgi:hypothetical protein
LDDITALRLLRSAMAPLLVNAGLVEMAATGSVHLAAVSLLAPGSLLLSGELIDTESIDMDAANGAIDGAFSLPQNTNDDESRLWDGALAAWYELP